MALGHQRPPLNPLSPKRKAPAVTGAFFVSMFVHISHYIARDARRFGSAPKPHLSKLFSPADWTNQRESQSRKIRCKAPRQGKRTNKPRKEIWGVGGEVLPEGEPFKERVLRSSKTPLAALLSLGQLTNRKKGLTVRNRVGGWRRGKAVRARLQAARPPLEHVTRLQLNTPT